MKVFYSCVPNHCYNAMYTLFLKANIITAQTTITPAHFRRRKNIPNFLKASKKSITKGISTVIMSVLSLEINHHNSSKLSASFIFNTF